MAPAVPPEPPLDPGRAIAVARGTQFACALRANGRVACWGENRDGQLGQGHTDPVEGAREVVGLEDAIDLAATAASACAVRRTGAVVCWGQGRELGSGREQRSGGRLVTVPDVSGADAVWGGLFRYCARTTAGTLCWGSRTPALDADVDRTLSGTRPHRVALEGVARMLLGWTSYALMRDGRVLRWGSGPEAPTELTGVRAAFAFVNGEYLARTDGTVTHAPADGPQVEVAGLRGARELSGTSYRIHGLTEDGRLLVVSRYDYAPPTVERGEGLAAMAPGEGDLVALTRDGAVRTWRQTDSTGRHLAALDVALPPTGAPSPGPAAPTGPLPAWCGLELRAVTPSESPSLASLWEVLARGRHDDDPGPADEAEARRWLCRTSRAGVAGCEADGPILVERGDHEGTALAWRGPGATVAWVGGLGVVSDGTEESSLIERVEVRSARPVDVMLEYSESEVDCFGEDDETCGLGEVRRRAFVALEHDAIVLVAELELDALAMRREGVSPGALPAPRVRVELGSVVVDACGGTTRRPIPALTLPSTSPPSGAPSAPSGEVAPAAGPPPTSADVEARLRGLGG